jgi:hypothetical protein
MEQVAPFQFWAGPFEAKRASTREGSLCGYSKKQSPAYTRGALDAPIIEGEGRGLVGASSQPTRLSGFRSGVPVPFRKPWSLLNFRVVPLERDRQGIKGIDIRALVV